MKNIQTIFGLMSLGVLAPWSVAQNTPTIFNLTPSRIVGQPSLQQQGVISQVGLNLVEGREFNSPQAIAIDTSASPPILYIADTFNNRVLAWKSAIGFTKGDFATKAIGQRDLFSTAREGPGQDLSTGLFTPIALAVDKSGNLYVADAGNNRILRYPTPLTQTGDLLPVDLIIGQKDLNGRSPNEGQTAPTQKSLNLSSGAGLTFDAQGNLWVADAANNRVLRFPASALGSPATNEPAADLVLGQATFVTNSLPTSGTQVQCGTTTALSNACNKTFLDFPSALAFDPKGRLFVADALNRVVVFTPPLQSGQFGSRIMGIDLTTLPNPPPAVSASTLGVSGIQSFLDIFFVGASPYVVDGANARVVGYDPFDNWADEPTAYSPPAKVVVGQPSLQGFQSNRGFPQPSNLTLAGPQPASGMPPLNGPAAGTFAGTEMFVVDTGNNRVMVFPQTGNTFGPATRLLGQLDFQYNSVNLIEGREFGLLFNNGSCGNLNGAGGGVAMDNSSNPPHLYVADPANNRVLGFLDARKLNAGVSADIVIGQPDLRTAEVNYPTNSSTQANDQGLWSPEQIAVDSNGDLFVADTCNARVLRFSSPFAQPFVALPRANLVLGQTSFFGQPIRDLSRQNMRSAYGLAFTASHNLVVSDPAANRVLYFKRPQGGDFKSGDPAANVIGQRDFISSTSSVINSPRGVAIDVDDQLYVADTGNARLAIFPNVTTSGDNPAVALAVPGLSAPLGVTVNPNTDEIWVANTNGNATFRFPMFASLAAQSVPTPNVAIVNFAPVSIALDAFGNPIVAEALTNRVEFFYRSIDTSSAAGGISGRFSGNGANYFQKFAPGMIASIFSYTNSRFGDQTTSYTNLPPTTLGDVQVFVAGIASPLFYVSPTQINFQVPAAVPLGPQEIQVVKASTNQVLASAFFRIDPYAPGLFTSDSTGAGQLAVGNEDGTVNSQAHPAKAGSVITLYGTGPGLLTNQPPDGQITNAAVNTPFKPNVIINGFELDPSDILYSGAAPAYVGLWQINARVPKNVPPQAVTVVVVYQGFSTNSDSNGNRRFQTIWTAP